MLRAHVAAGSVLVTFALVFSFSCDNGVSSEACTDIPEGGCPLSHGVACSDPACDAVYACRSNNVWELSERCSARDGSAGADAADVDAPVSADVSDASIDAPPGAWGGPGCTALQAPDCSLGLALSCGTTCCGCEDLYVCEVGGWTLWGTCAEGGPQPQR